MNTLKVNYLTLPNLQLQELPNWLDQNNAGWTSIDTINWPEQFPYKPQVKFRIVATDKGYVINYRVSEQTVRAVAPHDCGSVWEDSCVEFFSSPADDGYYYNVECNCAGTILVATGKDRHERTFASAEVLNNIQRWSSLGRKPFDEKAAPESWEVVLLVPYSTYFKHNITDVRGMQLRANFYKCGDKLTTPHFLSWNSIGTPNPDFHCPEYFGQLDIQP